MKLPPSSRESSPFGIFPGDFKSRSDASINAVVSIVSKSLPDASPSIFSFTLKQYIVRNIWVNVGTSDEANSTRALHSPISGQIAGLPGLTHEIRAVISLIMCARWGTDLGPSDKLLYNNLRRLIGSTLSFWCDYIGTVARLLAIILATCPTDKEILEQTIRYIILYILWPVLILNL